MTTERRVEHPDGTVEHVSTSENPTVIDRRSGGGMGFLGIIIAVLAIGVIGYFLFTMSQSQQVENNAVAGAAQSVGNAAESVGNAAERAVPGGD